MSKMKPKIDDKKLSRILKKKKLNNYINKTLSLSLNTFLSKKKPILYKFQIIAKRVLNNFYIKRYKYTENLFRSFFFKILTYNKIKKVRNNKNNNKIRWSKLFNVFNSRYKYKNISLEILYKTNTLKKKYLFCIKKLFKKYKKSFTGSFHKQLNKLKIQSHFHFIQKANFEIKNELIKQELENIRNVILNQKKQKKQIIYINVSTWKKKVWFKKKKLTNKLKKKLWKKINKRLKSKELERIRGEKNNFLKKIIRIKVFLSTHRNFYNKNFKKFKILKKNFKNCSVNKNKNVIKKKNYKPQNQIQKYVLFCKKKKNNFFLTLTNTRGGVILKKSAGTSGLKKKKQKKSKESIKIISRDLAKCIRKKNIKTVFRIYIINCFEKIGNIILWELKNQNINTKPTRIVSILRKPHSKPMKKKKLRRV